MISSSRIVSIYSDVTCGDTRAVSFPVRTTISTRVSAGKDCLN